MFRCKIYLLYEAFGQAQKVVHVHESLSVRTLKFALKRVSPKKLGGDK
jgi:hypothetical protein